MAIWAIGSALAGIAGGLAAKHAMNDYKNSLKEQAAENEDWYERKYNEDATQRADAQRALQITEDAVRKRNRAAAGSQAVMGGNEASVAAVREANSNATAEAASRIAAQAEARKDAVEQQYLANKRNYENQLNALNAGKASNISQAIQGVTSAAGNAMANLDYNNIWSRGGEVRIPAGARVGLSNIDAAKDAVAFGSYVDQLANKNRWNQ